MVRCFFLGTDVFGLARFGFVGWGAILLLFSFYFSVRSLYGFF